MNGTFIEKKVPTTVAQKKAVSVDMKQMVEKQTAPKMSARSNSRNFGVEPPQKMVFKREPSSKSIETVKANAMRKRMF